MRFKVGQVIRNLDSVIPQFKWRIDRVTENGYVVTPLIYKDIYKERFLSAHDRLVLAEGNGDNK